MSETIAGPKIVGGVRESTIELGMMRDVEVGMIDSNVTPMQSVLLQDEMTYFVFPCFKVTRKRLITLTTATLFLSLFMERYCFICSVYKTKYYGYTLIMIVIFFNCLFNFIVMKLEAPRKKKQENKLHEIFAIDREQKLGCCVFLFLGVLDMFYAFFVFWPANTIPMWLLVSLLQFFIPLNMFIRWCCMKLKFHRLQYWAGLIIVVAIALAFMDLHNEEFKDAYLPYMLLFLLSSCIDVVSHAVKESVVRSMPVIRAEFTFYASLAQLVCGIILMPLILDISMKYENFVGTPMQSYKE